MQHSKISTVRFQQGFLQRKRLHFSCISGKSEKRPDNQCSVNENRYYSRHKQMKWNRQPIAVRVAIITGIVAIITVTIPLLFRHSEQSDETFHSIQSSNVTVKSNSDNGSISIGGNNNGNVAQIKDSPNATVKQSVVNQIPQYITDQFGANDTNHVKLLSKSGDWTSIQILLTHMPLSNTIEAYANDHFMMDVDQNMGIATLFIGTNRSPFDLGNMIFSSWRIIDTNVTTFKIKYIADTSRTNRWKSLNDILMTPKLQAQ
jgi:hypothetical protein